MLHLKIKNKIYMSYHRCRTNLKYRDLGRNPTIILKIIMNIIRQYLIGCKCLWKVKEIKPGKKLIVSLFKCLNQNVKNY